MYDLARLHGNASAALLLLVALLSLTPLAGVSLFVLLIAFRWPRDDGAVAIPERLGRLRLDARWSSRCERGLRGLHERARRWLRPRWTVLLAPATHVGWGLWIGTMGLLILLPLPLANVLPACSLVLLSLGWMHRDGLALAASAVVGGAGVLYVALTGHLLVALASGAAAAFAASLAP